MTETITLQNGIRVVLEPMDGVASVAVGVWVNAGSVFESARIAGISHFIEHMLFKGTERRTAAQIAAEMDAIGGNLNAFTSKECTCYHVKALGEDLEKAVDMLADIVLHSTLAAEDIAREKGVVLEEIAMTADSPEDLVFERAGSAYFADTPLCGEILGTEKSVQGLSREDLVSYMQKHYTAENMVIAVAGSFSRDTLLALLEQSFASAAHSTLHPVPKVTPQGGLRTDLVQKDVEQVNTCLVFPGAALGTEDYYALAVLSNILGGSMSSRLFQHIREQRGLAYSVYSYPMSYRGTGNLCLYAGSSDAQAVEVLRLMLEEIDDLLQNGFTEEEFARCKQQLKGGFLLGMESSMAHMNALGKNMLLLGKEYHLETTLNRIECVTMQDVERICKTVFQKELGAFAAVGRLKSCKAALESRIQDWWNEHDRQATVPDDGNANG